MLFSFLDSDGLLFYALAFRLRLWRQNNPVNRLNSLSVLSSEHAAKNQDEVEPADDSITCNLAFCSRRSNLQNIATERTSLLTYLRTVGKTNAQICWKDLKVPLLWLNEKKTCRYHYGIGSFDGLTTG